MYLNFLNIQCNQIHTICECRDADSIPISRNRTKQRKIKKRAICRIGLQSHEHAQAAPNSTLRIILGANISGDNCIYVHMNDSINFASKFMNLRRTHTHTHSEANRVHRIAASSRNCTMQNRVILLVYCLLVCRISNRFSMLPVNFNILAGGSWHSNKHNGKSTALGTESHCGVFTIALFSDITIFLAVAR